MSPPDETKPQVIAHDPVAHTKLDRILEWIEGDPMAGKSGVAETIRRQEETLKDHSERLERHSARIHALESQDGVKAKSMLELLTEKALQLITMLLGSSIGGAIAQRISHH